MTDYEKFGKAATLPGLVAAVELLQELVEKLREEIADVAKEAQPTKKARKPNSYWDRMTPAQRSAEVKRRMSKRKKRPSDPLKKQPVLPSGRLSTTGLKRGTSEFRAVDAYNKRLRTAENYVNGEAVA